MTGSRVHSSRYHAVVCRVLASRPTLPQVSRHQMWSAVDPESRRGDLSIACMRREDLVEEAWDLEATSVTTGKSGTRV
jgi:hypothetical protein